MQQPLEDVVVVLPGIMGSVLRDRKGKGIWSPSLGALAGGLVSLGGGVKRLRLPEGIGDEHPGDGVVASALMPDLHVLPGIWSVHIGYARLQRWLRETQGLIPVTDTTLGNCIEFPYDWRLSNRYNARLLKATVEPLLERIRAVKGREDAQLIFLVHSMGGLVARYYVDVLGGYEITRKVITMGTPHRGALNALDSLVNGVRKGFGPLGLDLTGVARSLPAMYQLLPEYACIETPRGLAKVTEISVPELNTAMTADAMAFHAELETGAGRTDGKFTAYPILARTQPTATTARLAGGRVEPLLTLDGVDQGGDGTVPRLSAAPYGVASDNAILRYVMEKHGALTSNDAVHVELGGVLTGSPLISRPAVTEIGVEAPDVLLEGETLTVTATSQPGLLVEVILTTAAGSAAAAAERKRATDNDKDGRYLASFPGLAAGGYSLAVRVAGGGAAGAVTTPIAVFPQPAP